MEYEYQNGAVKEKESVISEYSRIIDESEKAYTKVFSATSLRCLNFILACWEFIEVAAGIRSWKYYVKRKKQI